MEPTCDRTAGPPLLWERGERVVRWTHPGGEVVKEYDRPPQSVMTWDGLVLVVEALDTTPFSPSDNAVVFWADGRERVRLRPPRDLVGDPSAVHGFYMAYPDAGHGGIPLVVIATRTGGDFRGRVDLEHGTVTDVGTFR
ncbi:hypothetical protein ACIQUQ_29430 [Streptomyces sp. NPDC101118]|uniref:hypothetical protein n=1 Tax=Streptomyces sp. NPDC101118 TaxID=3366109 RepID=UPI003810C85A